MVVGGLELEFVDPARESREVNRQTADFSKLHTVLRGEDLVSLAGRFYEDPRMWRAIALDNGIDSPRADLTGRRLRIPSLPFLHPETGEVLA